MFTNGNVSYSPTPTFQAQALFPILYLRCHSFFTLNFGEFQKALGATFFFSVIWLVTRNAQSFICATFIKHLHVFSSSSTNLAAIKTVLAHLSLFWELNQGFFYCARITFNCIVRHAGLLKRLGLTVANVLRVHFLRGKQFQLNLNGSGMLIHDKQPLTACLNSTTNLTHTFASLTQKFLPQMNQWVSFLEVL